METVFLFADQIEPQETEEPIGSNFETMVISILSGTPDPRLLPDNDD